MDDLLTPVSTAYKKSKVASNEPLLEVQKPAQDLSKPSPKPSTPEEALEVLRAEPDLQTLSATLKYLIHDAPSTSDFHINHPSPMAAQIVNVLVSAILPNYWFVLKETTSSSSRIDSEHGLERKLLLSCLRSITGLSAVLARLKALVQVVKEAGKMDSRHNQVEALEDHLDVLENLLRGETLLSHLWKYLPVETLAKQKALWHEITVVIGGGKLLNGAAEATSLINDASAQIRKVSWIADGILYSRWLARNMIHWFRDIQTIPEGSWNPFSDLFAKSVRLGYAGKSTKKESLFSLLTYLEIVLDVILALLQRKDDDRKQFRALLGNLPNYEQKMVLDAALRTLSKRHLSTNIASDSLDWWRVDAEVVAGAAGYLEFIVSQDSSRISHLISWLTSLSGAGIGEAVGIRRAAVAVLSDSKYDMESVLEKSLQQFGDQLYIKHAPSLQQEGMKNA
jgi:telomere length regulation protein